MRLDAPPFRLTNRLSVPLLISQQGVPGLMTHVPPSGKHLKAKSGTQIIDRAWRSIKDRVRRSAAAKAGTKLLATRIRSAQYD